VKAASEIYAPADGEVLEVNEALNDEPGKVNSAAEGEGWFFKMKLSDPSQVANLMDEAAYKAFIEG
jgi:glycine cleavage system H protein